MTIPKFIDFELRIKQMNETFKLPSNIKPTDQGVERLAKFCRVLHDEMSELHEVFPLDASKPAPNFTALADCLGDIVVYCFSEARRWGIPLIDVLHLIMDSQESKLIDGKPLMAEDGSKFLKGPNYTPPEENIHRLLESL